jgi:hypothetical protein
VAAVVAAMQAHVDVAAVQEAGCTALVNLSNFQSLIRSSGGVEAARVAMRTFSAIQLIQESGQRVIDLVGYSLRGSCFVASNLLFLT